MITIISIYMIHDLLPNFSASNFIIIYYKILFLHLLQYTTLQATWSRLTGKGLDFV